MSTHTEDEARIYRFRNEVAIDFPGTKQLYLTPEIALGLAREIIDCALDIQQQSFMSSGFGIRRVSADWVAKPYESEYRPDPDDLHAVVNYDEDASDDQA